MKLVQLNIWCGKLLAQAIKFIDEEKPDILTLQEVYSTPNTYLSTLEGMYSTLETLQKATGLKNTFFSRTFSTVNGGISMDFGNAILTNFDISNKKTVFTNGEYQSQIDMLDPINNIRNLQVATLDTGKGNLVIANHHGFWDKNPLGTEETFEKMKIAFNALKQEEKPLIFAGDLNVTAQSPAMNLFDGFLTDLTKEHKITTTLSQLGKVEDVPCDHILISPEIKELSFQVSNKLVSDHLAIVFEFDI
jgi:endonuclease/exonuclease/phosphatase family metal-dependent hydrolase